MWRFAPRCTEPSHRAARERAWEYAFVALWGLRVVRNGVCPRLSVVRRR
jgi:hypothetical protein